MSASILAGSRDFTILLEGSNNENTEFESLHFLIEVRAAQPGNNWQVADHDEQRIVKSFTYETTSQIGFRGDGKTLLRTGTKTAAKIDDDLSTDIVTAHRTLWIEHDVMGNPDAQTNRNLRGVFDGEVGCNGCDDPIEFDTSLDLSVLEGLVSVASVRVKVMPVGPGFNKRSVIPFVHYVPYLPTESVAGDLVKPFQDVLSQEDFWNVHLVSGYEADNRKDNDPDSIFSPLNWTLGYCFFISQATGGPTILYREEIRDVLATPRIGPGLEFVRNFTAVVTAHEILHRFFGNHGQSPSVNNVGIMDWEFALLQQIGQPRTLVLTDLQLQYVQTRDFPR